MKQIIVKDFLGRQIKPGDRVVYVTRNSSEIILHSGQVVDLSHDPRVPGSETVLVRKNDSKTGRVVPLSYPERMVIVCSCVDRRE